MAPSSRTRERNTTRCAARPLEILLRVRFWSIACLVGCAMIAGALTAELGAKEVPQFADASRERAKSYIAGLVDPALARILATPAPERPRELQRLFEEHVDLAALAKFILGRYWRLASEDERTEFVRLFEALIVRTSDEGLESYSGEKLRVLDARAADENGEILVRSELIRAEGPAVQIDWRVRQDHDRFKIADITVEGMSIRIALRDIFAAAVQEKGGTTAALLAAMRALLSRP